MNRHDAIIVCIDQSSTDFATYCLTKAILYLDITANTNFLSQLRKLNGYAHQHRALAVVSLGLCPGLTNLLAAELITRYPHADEISTGILLGLGEKHGKAAIEWTLDNLIKDFEYHHTPVQSFGKSKEFQFAGINGKRKAYRFNFSDQHALKENYPEKSFATYLCLDSPWVTRLLSRLKKTGVTRLLHTKLLKKIAIRLFDSFSMGESIFAVSTSAYHNGKLLDRLSVSGKEESVITAKVTVICLEQFIGFNKYFGVMDLQQLLTLQVFWEELKSELFPCKQLSENISSN
ncbi:hypothetical protein AAG747_27965 [Rapidithrix thailandica]|uniref:Nucleoside phosphorylase domain-containing protein n=1 Tax=Rapidithrix thailandica TaxID=413964 RepID=A0AAW9SFX1_9BACT